MLKKKLLYIKKDILQIKKLLYILAKKYISKGNIIVDQNNLKIPGQKCLVQIKLINFAIIFLYIQLVVREID